MYVCENPPVVEAAADALGPACDAGPAPGHFEEETLEELPSDPHAP